MSLNKLTSSTDYLSKQFLNIGCNDIKCSTLEIAGNSINQSYDYAPTIILTTPNNMSATAPFTLWHTIGDQITLSVKSFNLILPTNSDTIQIELPLPVGYIGFGAGFEKVSLVGQVVNPTNGTSFLPVISTFTLDNKNIVCNFKASSPHSGTFNTSLSITAKIVKL